MTTITAPIGTVGHHFRNNVLLLQEYVLPTREPEWSTEFYRALALHFGPDTKPYDADAHPVSKKRRRLRRPGLEPVIPLGPYLHTSP